MLLLVLLQMPEYVVQPIVTHAEGRKDISRCVGPGLLYVVVLEVYKLLILDGAFGGLPMEERSKRPNLLMLHTVLKITNSLLSSTSRQSSGLN